MRTLFGPLSGTETAQLYKLVMENRNCPGVEGFSMDSGYEVHPQRGDFPRTIQQWLSNRAFERAVDSTRGPFYYRPNPMGEQESFTIPPPAQVCYGTRTIRMFRARSLGQPHVIAYKVNLSVLTPAARVLASQITTTLNRDSMSDVQVQSHLSNEKLIRRDWPAWTDDPNINYKHPTTGAQTLESHLNHLRAVYGDEYLAEHPVILWRWDALRPSEMPEEYLERHARTIAQQGKIVSKMQTEPTHTASAEAN